REEQVGAAVVRAQEAVTIGMALDDARHQMQLCDRAEITLAIGEDLYVALHRGQTRGEGMPRPLVDAPLAQELFGGHGRALPRFEPRRARWHEIGIPIVAALGALIMRAPLAWRIVGTRPRAVAKFGGGVMG